MDIAHIAPSGSGNSTIIAPSGSGNNTIIAPSVPDNNSNLAHPTSMDFGLQPGLYDLFNGHGHDHAASDPTSSLAHPDHVNYPTTQLHLIPRHLRLPPQQQQSTTSTMAPLPTASYEDLRAASGLFDMSTRHHQQQQQQSYPHAYSNGHGHGHSNPKSLPIVGHYRDPRAGFVRFGSDRDFNSHGYHAPVDPSSTEKVKEGNLTRVPFADQLAASLVNPAAKHPSTVSASGHTMVYPSPGSDVIFAASSSASPHHWSAHPQAFSSLGPAADCPLDSSVFNATATTGSKRHRDSFDLPDAAPPVRKVARTSSYASHLTTASDSSSAALNTTIKPPRKRKPHAASTVGPTPTPRPNLTEEEKRQNHIRSEKTRRDLIKNSYDVLNALVPALKHGKSGLSRAEILREIAVMVDALCRGNDEMAVGLGFKIER